MSQKTRIWIGLGVLALIVVLVVGVDVLRRSTASLPAAVIVTATSESPENTAIAGSTSAAISPVAQATATQAATATAVTLQPGSIPIYVNGILTAAFSPGDLDKLAKTSFIEPVEGKTEEGWLLRDVLLLYLPESVLQADSLVTVSSSSREKSALLTWVEIDLADNMVMFDLAGRGTLKLVSKLEKLDTREEWVQDVDKIEVNQP